MSPSPSETMELVVAINRVLDRLDRFERQDGATNSAQITVQAGGIGLWLAALCACVCLVMTLVLGMLFLDHSRKIDDLGHYLQAIYAQAPQLKPEEDE